MNIKTAAKQLGVGETYVRKLLRDGSLKGTKVPVKEGIVTMRHEITEEEIARFKALPKQRFGQRADQRNKYSLYATLEQVEKIRKENPEILIDRANKRKAKQDAPATKAKN